MKLEHGARLPNPSLANVPRAVACPLCSGTDLETYLCGDDRKLDAADLGSSRKEISHGTILRCRTCCFGFRAFRSPDDEVSALYRKLDASVYERESRGRDKTARRHLRIVRRFVSAGRLLDVGCASGSFLRCAADSGWQVVGVEPSEVLCAKARASLGDRGEVFCVPLQNAGLAPASFDALTLWDVLEHVTEPRAFMQLCASLLKPGGYFFVNVPDLDSLPARLLGERWPLLLAEHLNYFNRASLRRCGELAQLRAIAFGQRPASFSLEYLFYRLRQHRVPGATLGQAIASTPFLKNVSLPVFLGESYGVWTRPAGAS